VSSFFPPPVCWRGFPLSLPPAGEQEGLLWALFPAVPGRGKGGTKTPPFPPSNLIWTPSFFKPLSYLSRDAFRLPLRRERTFSVAARRAVLLGLVLSDFSEHSREPELTFLPSGEGRMGGNVFSFFFFRTWAPVCLSF